MSSLQEYRTFVAVVEELSLTQAAKRLHRSASAVSKQLAKLEDQLGVQLIDRTTQSIVVTRHGRDFYTRCRSILAAVDEAERALRESYETPQGKLSVSVSEVLINSQLMEHLGEFYERYPAVRFDLQISNQVEDLLQNQIDFAFRASETVDDRLVAFPVTDLKMIAVASPAYRRRANLPSSIADLIRYGHLIVPTEINVSRAIAQMAPELAGMAVDLDVQNTTNTLGATVEMAKAGLGVAVVTDFAVSQHLESGALVDVLPGKVFFKQQVRLVYRRRMPLPRVMELFKSFIREKYAPATAWAPTTG